MIMSLRILIDRERIAEFCCTHHIQRLAVFGSALRDDFRQDSDVDILVWFDPDHTPGLIRFMSMQNELTDVIGRSVDLRTPDELSRYFRDEVVAQSEMQYAA